ncbi:MAG: bifunctional DNA-formamidopyrimidine glycosylase/DNA-(apurinic or apyrimidinic site) lyase [Candidatus Margulisbacteria bacterium]|nr:bifunctional DNA-formamidopyrimidine glycosylase/DNA-(apurinic or apyrimidinic site) lyase [Candidatus Margulisiibacteriota bacterium]
MPELPEVETISRDLNQHITGSTIANVTIYDGRNLRNINETEFKKGTESSSILNVYRLGKVCVWNLSNENSLLFHLRMTGKFIIQGKNPNKEKHSMLKFSTNKENIIFEDIRKFATINLIKTKELKSNSYVQKIGIDPTTPEFTLLKLGKIIKNIPNKNLKQLLLEQNHLVGIGNIYASEILFESQISPQRLAKSLTKEEIKNLYIAIKNILQKAIELRGTTFSDYRDGFNKKGGFQNKLKVYNKYTQNCIICNNKISKIKQNGRSTFYCENCQK